MHVIFFQFYGMGKSNPAYDEIASALRRRGHTVWVGRLDELGELVWCEGERVVTTQAGPSRMPGWLHRLPGIGQIGERVSWFRFLLRVRGFVRQAKPNVVQVSTDTYPWVLPLFMPEGICFVLDIRQINEKVSGSLLTRVREQQLIRTQAVCARFVYDRTCFLHARGAQRILGENWPRWGKVVPIGVDERFLELERCRPAPDNVGRPVRFVYVGGLSRFRSLETLILAAKRLLAESDRFRMDLVGWDKSGGYLQQFVDSLGLGGVVAIRPPVPYHEVAGLLDGYDVGLAYVPDRPTWDYHPTIKVLEYRALGLPILSTDVASHREVVEDGVNGLLVQDTVDSIAEGMKRFVIDRDFLGRCRVNARAMRQGVTWDAVARTYEENVYPARDPGSAGFLAQGR